MASTEYFGIFGWNTKYMIAAKMPMISICSRIRDMVQHKHFLQQLFLGGGFEGAYGIVRRNGGYSSAGSPLSERKEPRGTNGAVAVCGVAASGSLTG